MSDDYLEIICDRYKKELELELGDTQKIKHDFVVVQAEFNGFTKGMAQGVAIMKEALGEKI